MRNELKSIIVLLAIIVTGIVLSGNSWATDPDFYEVQAVSGDQFFTATAIRDDYNESVIKVTVPPNSPVGDWEIPMGRGWVQAIRSEGNCVFSFSYSESWNVGVGFFDAAKKDSMKKLLFYDSLYMKSWKFLGIDKGFLVAVSDSTSNGYLKKVGTDWTSKNVMTFPASKTVSFGWTKINLVTGAWDPLVNLTTSKGATAIYRIYWWNGKTELVKSKKFPAGTEIIYTYCSPDFIWVDRNVHIQDFIELTPQ